MFQRILVPLDGSARAEYAIPVAARIARATHGTIVFVRVVIPPIEFGTYGSEPTIGSKPTLYETELVTATHYLTDAVAMTYAKDLAGIATEMEVVSGASAPTIFSEARLEHADLIVLCSHGETGLKRWVFDSVAQQAVRHSPVPVLVLNEHGVLPSPAQAGSPFRVLVTLDGSALAEAALEPAAQLVAALATPARGSLHLLRVVGILPVYEQLYSEDSLATMMQEDARQEAQAYLHTIVERVREDSLADPQLTITSSVVVSSEVARTIIRLAEQAEEGKGGYDLIAMATHGWGGLRHLVMGSVTEHVLGATKLPLLIVRPTEIPAQTQKEEAVGVEAASE